jgi:acyl-CoA synthetase (AMP-forming)/AMP-acid ligase II
VLYAHPSVLQAAVIGIPHEQWGETVKAILVLREGAQATEEEIIEYCRQNLAEYKKPRVVEFRDSLPMNPSGKVLKRELRDEHWKGKERRV